MLPARPADLRQAGSSRAETIRFRLDAKAFLHKGLKIVFKDEAAETTEDVFEHAGGIADFLTKLVTERGKAADGAAGLLLRARRRGAAFRIEVALQWTESHEETIRSYVNGIPTTQGGTHEQGFRAAIVKAVRAFIETTNLAPKGVTLTAEDIREGVVGVLSIYVQEPQFQGQTKERLGSPEAQAQVDGAVRPALEKFLLENKTAGAQIVERIALAAKAREASRAAAQAVSRKTAVSHRLNLPGKLADCSSTDPGKSELFIVEGDSAGGSAKQGRERKTQAILPLRGKVLNTEQASLQKVLANKELQDIVSALGCGVGDDFKIERLRYHKIILLMDADSDGHHIATLLLTFFYRHLQPLITGGLRLPGAAAALPHRLRQGDVLGARRGRPRPHRRRAAQEREARHHAVQGPRRDAARGAAPHDARSGDAPPAARDDRRRRRRPTEF